MGEEDVVEHAGLHVVGGLSFSTERGGGSYVDLNARPIVRRELDAQSVPQHLGAEPAQILVEVGQCGASISASTPAARARPARVSTAWCPADHCPARGRAVVNRRAVRARRGGWPRRGRRRHCRHDLPKREDRFQPFSGDHDVDRAAEPDAVAKQQAHSAAGRRDQRFAGRPGIEPGAVRTGHRAIERRDRRDQRGPGIPSLIARVVIVAAIPAPRMEAEGLQPLRSLIPRACR